VALDASIGAEAVNRCDLDARLPVTLDAIPGISLHHSTQLEGSYSSNRAVATPAPGSIRTFAAVNAHVRYGPKADIVQRSDIRPHSSGRFEMRLGWNPRKFF